MRLTCLDNDHHNNDYHDRARNNNDYHDQHNNNMQPNFGSMLCWESLL
jgi:hypothetical protein